MKFLYFRIYDSGDGNLTPDVQVITSLGGDGQFGGGDDTLFDPSGTSDTETNDITDINALYSLSLEDTIFVDIAGADTTWDFTGINSGTVTIGDYNSINFAGIDNIEGSDSIDKFVFDDLAGITGDINDGTGDLELQLFDYFFLTGDFDFVSVKSADLILNDGTDFTNIDYKLLSGVGVDAFVGNGPATEPGATGLSLTDIDFSLLLFTDEATSTSYTALKTSGGSASLVGFPDLTLGAWSVNVEINQTSDSLNPDKVLDFNDGSADSIAGIPVTPATGPVIDFEGENGSLLNVSGSAVIDAFGVLIAKGSFSISLGQVVEDGVPGTTYQAMVLQLGSTARGSQCG
ncbi:MAG: hypothetical protein P8Z78_13455 [Gammaproteobacteria bacterium]